MWYSIPKLLDAALFKELIIYGLFQGYINLKTPNHAIHIELLTLHGLFFLLFYGYLVKEMVFLFFW